MAMTMITKRADHCRLSKKELMDILDVKIRVMARRLVWTSNWILCFIGSCR